MKNELKNKLEKEAKYLHIVIPYNKGTQMIMFDDGMMTNLECNENFKPPMLNSEDMLLEYFIDLKERKVLNWNYKDGYLRMWAKVQDSGTYTLLNIEKNPLWEIRGYVPNKLIPPIEKGYGDYIELAIKADGSIANWPITPDLSEFVEGGKIPTPIKSNKWYRAEKALWEVVNMKLNKEEMKWLIGELIKIREND